MTVEVAAGVASDAHGHLNSAAVPYSVEADLTPPSAASNQPPQFSGSSARSVAENTPSGAAIGAPVAATDADGDPLTYSLSGTDAASFAVDSGSGQLRTRAALNYEARTTYAVTVAVSDGQGGSARQAVTLSVTDVDEPPPAPGTPVVTGASLTKLTVRWTAPASAGGPPVSGYDLQVRVAGSGAAFADAGTVGNGTKTTLDGLEKSTDYEVRVRARNDEGAGPWSASGQGRTHDADASPADLSEQAPAAAARTNQAPQFGSSGSGGDSALQRSVAENTPSGAAIGAPVGATDADADTLTYHLEGADAASFSVDAGSGQLRTLAALDYETRTAYAVTVAVSDGQGGSARQAVAIGVTDVDEAPIAADDAAAVDEGGSVTIDVLANDVDAEGNALTIHLVEEAGHGALRIASGAVTYTHDGGETRVDGFGYRVHDGNLYSEAARVTIAVAAVNDAPIADAGPDQTVAEGEAVSLEGSGTDPEEEALSYAWSQVSGAPVSLSDAASAAPGFRAPAQLSADAALVFRLVVTDASGADSAPDEVTVTVEAGANDAPVADAGADQTVDEGDGVSLQGSGTDPEGEALTFAWSQVSGAAVELSGADSDSLSFSAPEMLAEDAVLVFALVVSDARDLASAPDEVDRHGDGRAQRGAGLRGVRLHLRAGGARRRPRQPADGGRRARPRPRGRSRDLRPGRRRQQPLRGGRGQRPDHLHGLRRRRRGHRVLPARGERRRPAAGLVHHHGEHSGGCGAVGPEERAQRRAEGHQAASARRGDGADPGRPGPHPGGEHGGRARAPGRVVGLGAGGLLRRGGRAPGRGRFGGRCGGRFGGAAPRRDAGRPGRRRRRDVRDG